MYLTTTKKESLMNSKKEDAAKVKKIEKELTEALKKLERLKKDNRRCRQKINQLKQRIRELIKSRDRWKAKLKVKQEEVKKLKVKISRVGKAKWHQYATWLIGLCVLLRIYCGCSYGCIRRILVLLNSYFQLGLKKLPCENTIQNWVSKMGLYTMKQGTYNSTGEQVSLIIDESIRLGQEKLLLILSIPFNKLKQGALSFQEVQVVFMKGATSWTGKKISEVIEKLQKTYGFEVINILSDEDSKLKKACRLLEISHVPDISHAVATCLKRVFEKTEEYKKFKTLLASYASKGVNQALSYLCPPKQRTKARFMNLQRVVKWANKMLERFDKLNKKEALFFKDLTAQASLVNLLESCLCLAKAISLPFKLKGLSTQTIQQAQKQITLMNVEEDYLKAFLKEIKKYLTHYQDIIETFEGKSIHASSEIIESMFGKYKSKANNYALTGLTSLNLELPIYGISIEKVPPQMVDALEGISIVDLIQWREDNSSDNQLVKRLRWFKNEK